MGAAALMELAGMEAGQSEVAPPRCKLDLLRMGADCRRRGTEMVIVRDADFKFLHLLEIRVEEMEKYRCYARGQIREVCLFPRSSNSASRKEGVSGSDSSSWMC
jgi:hypothetical protein